MLALARSLTTSMDAWLQTLWLIQQLCFSAQYRGSSSLMVKLKSLIYYHHSKPLKAEDALSIREFLLKLWIFFTDNGRKHVKQKLNNFENSCRGESGQCWSTFIS